MAGYAKTTCFINGGQGGFSDSFYGTFSDETPGTDSHIERLLVARAALLSAGRNATPTKIAVPPYTMEGYRVANVNGQNDSHPFPATLAMQTANSENPVFSSGANTINFAVVSKDGKHRRILQLRGAPGEWFIQEANTRRAGFDILAPGAKRPVKKFETELAGENGAGNFWFIKFTQRTAAAGDSRVREIRKDNDGNLIIITDATGLTIGQTIIVRGLRGIGTRGTNGRARIIDQTGSAYTLDKRVCDVCLSTVFMPVKKGNVYIPSTDFAQIGACRVIGYTSRKIGRAFFAGAGRRPKACC